jgi:hypothetical protein
MDRDRQQRSKSSLSSEKKKQKKEKKRKHHDDVNSTSPIVNGTSSSGNRSGKNKAKRESRRKEAEENANDSAIDKNGLTSAQHVQQSPKISRSLSPPKESQTTLKETTTTTTTSTGKPEFTFSSLLATSPSPGTSKLKRSPYKIKTMQGSVALLPSSLPDVPTCIKSRLNSLLLMFNANIGGVLLSLEEGIELLPIDQKAADRGNHASSTSRYTEGLIGGRIVDDLPYIHYRFQAKGLTFCPIVGMKLKGKVVECTPTFVTLTTHHIISTKISTERLHQQGFFFNLMSTEWTRERDRGDTVNGEEDADNLGPSTSIYLDDIVEFVIERIHECGGYISLDGTRPSVSTG